MKFAICFLVCFVACSATDDLKDTELKSPMEKRSDTVTANTQFRLADSSTYTSANGKSYKTGRLEAYLEKYDLKTQTTSSQWGPVCADWLRMTNEKDVACRHMGYNRAVFGMKASYNPAYGSIMIDHMVCLDKAAESLADCSIFAPFYIVPAEATFCKSVLELICEVA